MNLIKNNEIFLLEEVIRKNFAAKYKDSVLGIFWSLLKPLLIMILLTIIFSTIFGRTIEHYAVYFLSARCIYDFFNMSVGVSMNAIKSNSNILKRSAAPKYIFVLGGILSEFLNFIISIIILVAVMIATNTPFPFETIPFSIIPIISLFIMILGLGFLLSISCVYYTDIQHLWAVLSLMIMYGSALFYPMEIIPEPYKNYMILNPLYWIIDQFRDFVLYGTIHDPLNIINSLLISTIILIIGIIIYKKYEKEVTMKF